MNKKWVMFNLLIKKNGILRADFLKRHKVLYHLGKHCYWQPITIPSEPYLLNIHNNVAVTSGVKFITHDIIDYMLNYKFKEKNFRQHIGAIEVYDNVFIGSNSLIMDDLKIGPNAIIAAGSIVTHDVPEGSIVGGNPARVIGSFNDLVKRRQQDEGPFKNEGIETITRHYWG